MYNYNTGTVSGYYNQLAYASSITQTYFRLIGKINLDALGDNATASYTELTLSYGGNTFSYMGNFTQDATGAITGGTLTNLTVLDNLGQKIIISGASLNAATIDNLLNTTLYTDLTGLYNYIMSPTEACPEFCVNVAFSNVAGQLRFVSASNSLFGDINGDGIADFEIALTGVTSLTADDFIL